MSELNIENFKIARQWLIDSKEAQIDMRYYISQPDEGSTFNTMVDYQVHGNSECGTAFCLAGLIQKEAAQGYDREIHSDLFAERFLGLSADQSNELFLGGQGTFYENLPLADVKKSHVLDKLDQVIKAGKWPDSFE